MRTISIPVEALASIPLRCAWRGCRQSCASQPTPLPAGWVCLVTFRETSKAAVLDFARDRTFRDGVLCPEHVAALEALLERIN